MKVNKVLGYCLVGQRVIISDRKVEFFNGTGSEYYQQKRDIDKATVCAMEASNNTLYIYIERNKTE